MVTIRNITISIVFSAITSFAGSDSCFNLLDYVPPTYRYHMLEVKPDISLQKNLGSSKASSVDTDSNRVTRSTETRSRMDNPLFGFDVAHRYYGWNGRSQWSLSSRIGMDGALKNQIPQYRYERGSPQSYSDNRQRNGAAQGRVTASGEYYFAWPFFTGAELSTSLSGGSERNRDVAKKFTSFSMVDSDSGTYRYTETVSRNRQYYATCNGSISMGAGRIEDITFAVAAMNMLDRIAANEKFYKGCSPKNVQDFAVLIETAKRRRYFDYRIAFIENIDTLCSFIRQNGITNEISPRTVLELADQWQYVFHQSRKKGYNFKVYPSAYYTRMFDHTIFNASECQQQVAGPFTLDPDNMNDVGSCSVTSSPKDSWDVTDRFTYGFNLNYLFERPLSRYYQFSFQSLASGLIERYWRTQWNATNGLQGDEQYASPVLSVMESATLAWYPHTRTSVGITESIRYRQVFDYYDMQQYGYTVQDDPPFDNYDDRMLTMALDGDVTYYISPRLQVTLNLGVNWNNTNRFSYGPPPIRNVSDYTLEATKGFTYSIISNLTWKLF